MGRSLEWTRMGGGEWTARSKDGWDWHVIKDDGRQVFDLMKLHDESGAGADHGSFGLLRLAKDYAQEREKDL